MFTSANAVNFFMERLQNLGKDIDILKGTSICCIGPKTAEAIGPFGLKADLVPADFKAEGVLAALGQLRVKGQKFLFPRAKEAREILPDRLRELGAEVTVAIAYENVKPVAGAEHVKKLFEGKKIDVVTFTSPSTVRRCACCLYWSNHGQIGQGVRHKNGHHANRIYHPCTDRGDGEVFKEHIITLRGTSGSMEQRRERTNSILSVLLT
jgi:hypothetical protein